MKKLSILIIIALLLTAACTGAARPATDGLSIVVTSFAAYDFARELAGDCEITLLLPPGAESHSFEPTPRDIITIEGCNIFIYTGGESESWVDGVLESVENSGMAVVAMMDAVETVTEEIKEGMQHEEHGHGEDADEHVWTSPKNAMLICESITAALLAADPEGGYRENLDIYNEKLEALDRDFREVVDAATRKTLIFGDRFPFRYLTLEYGLDYYAAFPGCAEETEPSARTVTFLIEKVKSESIPVVFHIEMSNEKLADTICEASGAKKLLLHSCHNVSRAELESGVSYLSLMGQNVEALREALV